jgi:hypothetical protein
VTAYQLARPWVQTSVHEKQSQNKNLKKQIVAPRPAALPSLEGLLETQKLGQTSSELELRCSKIPRGFLCTLSHMGSLKKILSLGSTLNDSDLVDIGIRYGLNIVFLVDWFFFCFLVAVKLFELGFKHLVGRYSTTGDTLPALFCVEHFRDGVLQIVCPG